MLLIFPHILMTKPLIKKIIRRLINDENRSVTALRITTGKYSIIDQIIDTILRMWLSTKRADVWNPILAPSFQKNIIWYCRHTFWFTWLKNHLQTEHSYIRERGHLIFVYRFVMQADNKSHKQSVHICTGRSRNWLYWNNELWIPQQSASNPIAPTEPTTMNL